MNDDGKWEEEDIPFEDKVKAVSDLFTPEDTGKFEEFAEKLEFGIKLTFDFQHEDYSNPEEEINLLSFFIV
jgi:hypothetical protein